MTQWLYKWLPIIFGCHCRDDRSFHYHGRRFPVCARCTGELVGMLLCVLTAWFYMPPMWLAAVMILPLVVDGSVQLLTHYESTNFRRAVTGVLFGYGFAAMLIGSALAVFWFGYRLGQRL